MMTMHLLICEAIRTRRRLELDYDGLHRVVEPYCHGIGANGSELLRAVQVAGASSSAKLGFGKLWTVDKMKNVRVSEPFTPNDPDYNPDDSAMATICCRV